jgi:serine/threonine protein kinase
MFLTAKAKELSQTGDYDLLEKRGEGAMGAVYRARHRVNGDIVAVKIVNKDVVRDAVLLKRFEREFQVARRLDNPHVVRSLDVSLTTTPPFLVMEYIDGPSLGDIIESRGALPEDEAISLITQVAEALHEAHQKGIYHRDVKPDNILITADGQAKLTDLGLAKDLKSEFDLTCMGKGLGTPHFMAPEQIVNAKNVDARCDVYGLGATLYMMVTGTIPFFSDEPLIAMFKKKARNEYTPPRTLRPQLSDRVDEVINRAMHAEAGQRYSTCLDFIVALGGKVSCEPRAASDPSAPNEPRQSETNADQAFSKPESKGQTGERVLHEDSRVLVTTTRVVIEGKTYSTASIASVAVGRVPPDLSAAGAVFGVGVLAGVGALFVERFTIPVGLLSLVLIIFGIFAAGDAQAKRKYSVQVRGASGEDHVLISRDAQYVTQIVNAIKRAISERA